MKNKQKNIQKSSGLKGKAVLEQVKSARKQSREEEIQAHGKLLNYRKIMESKKKYNRKKNKADDEVLPYFFLKTLQVSFLYFYQILTLLSVGTNNLFSLPIPNASYHA